VPPARVEVSKGEPSAKFEAHAWRRGLDLALLAVPPAPARDQPALICPAARVAPNRVILVPSPSVSAVPNAPVVAVLSAAEASAAV